MSASTGTTVAMLAAALVLLGLGMIALAVWLVRSTRSDPQALGPLEVMGGRRWRKADADRRQVNLDTARPAGATPPVPMVVVESGDGDTAGGSTDEADGAGGVTADADGGEGDTSDGVTAEETAEGGVGEPAVVDGDGGHDDTSDGAVADEDASDCDDAEPSTLQSTVSAPTSENEPADAGTNVEANKTE
jgi:hypothetical protein